MPMWRPQAAAVLCTMACPPPIPLSTFAALHRSNSGLYSADLFGLGLGAAAMVDARFDLCAAVSISHKED